MQLVVFHSCIYNMLHHCCSICRLILIVMNPKDLQQRLSDEGFKDRLIVYIEKLIKLDFDWHDEPDEIEIHGRGKWEHPSYQFPCYDHQEHNVSTTGVE